MSKQKSNPLSTTSKNEEGLNNFCAIRERGDREERLRKLLTLYNSEEFKKDKQKYLYLLKQLPMFINEVINDTRNSILPKNEEHNTDKKSSPDFESKMNKRIKSLKELYKQIGFDLLEMDSSNLKDFVELSQKPATARIFKTKDLQLKSGEKIPEIPIEIPGLQIEDLWGPTDRDFPSSPIPGLQEDYEYRQLSINPSKETQQNRDFISLINNNIRAEVIKYLFIEVFRVIEEIYEGNHAVEMINEFNANVEKIFLIAKHLTKEFAEPKTSEKHLHLKKLKKITETLKIFIDESPLSYLISEKDLILKKNVSKENSADKKKIDLKIEYSLVEINNQSKKFEKKLLEAAKFLDNQNIQSTKPSADTISPFAENVLKKSNAKTQKLERD